jgi:adenosine/AMP kinase
MEFSSVRLDVPEGCNVILGQSHFIKTVEDLYEVLACGVPQARFGIAFCEASGACLIRSEGNDEAMKEAAIANAQKISAGHTFVIVMRDAYPINVLNAVKLCQEVCTIFCATANPVEVVIAQSRQGRGIMGVIDGSPPKGVEGEKDVEWRKELLRKIGYKR